MHVLFVPLGSQGAADADATCWGWSTSSERRSPHEEQAREDATAERSGRLISEMLTKSKAGSEIKAGRDVHVHIGDSSQPGTKAKQ